MTFKTKKIGALNHHAEFVELAQKILLEYINWQNIAS